jgi:hypothetical protein
MLIFKAFKFKVQNSGFLKTIAILADLFKAEKFVKSERSRIFAVPKKCQAHNQKLVKKWQIINQL